MGWKTEEKFYVEKIAVLYQDVYRLLRARTKNKSIAEDLTQIVMEKAWKGLPMLRNRDKPKSWLFQIARNELKLYYRDNNKFLYDEEAVDYSSAEVRKVREDVLEILLIKEQRRTVIRALELLDERYRDIVELWGIAGLSQKEISEALDINYSTVRTNLHRGLKQLRELFDSLERGDFL